jgi:Na+/proline symporter
MTLSPIDWIIIVVYLLGCMAAGVWMRRYIRGVTDFAVAGREMDLNLGIASLAATEMGIITVMYAAQFGFKNGPAGATVGVMTAAAMLLVGCTGFIIRPLRDAGVITIPELFEKRFGKRVRWLAGLAIILGGVLNMGIFLQVGGKFLVQVTGMELDYLKWTMTALLGMVLLYTMLGGMLSVLVTDYIQFLVMGLGIVVTSVLVVSTVGWSDFLSGLTTAHEMGQQYQATRELETAQQREAVEALRQAKGAEAATALRQTQAEGHAERLVRDKAKLANAAVLVVNTPEKTEAVTMANPFNPASPTGLGWMYVVWQAMFQIAVVTTWQTMITRVLSAKDSRTATRMYSRAAFYFVGRWALPGLWGAAAFLYFWSQGGLPEGIDSLTAMPAYLKTLLPIGVIGVLIAAMLAAEMSTDSGYLLTWATVIYNDLISPCLRRPMPAKARLFTVRSLVLAIGIFLLIYGLWYKIPGNAWDYLAVTGNIYLASVFTLLVGALYWRGSNSWGAMAAIILGAIGPLAFLIVNGIVKSPRFNIDPSWEIPPEVAGFAAFGMSFAGMFFGSLLGRRLGHAAADANAARPAQEETRP